MIQVRIGHYYADYPETREGIDLAKKFLDVCAEHLNELSEQKTEVKP